MSSINSISNSGIPPALQGRDASTGSRGVSAQGANTTGPHTAAPATDTGVTAAAGAGGAKSAGSAAQPTKDQVDQALEGLIKQLSSKPTSVQFSVDEKLNQMVIKVVDPATHKVIKQIPAEAILRMREDLLSFDSKSPTGLLLSEKT